MIHVDVEAGTEPHFVDSTYVRQWWTSLLGPTAVACLRLLTQRTDWDEYELAALLGISTKQRKLQLVLERLEKFKVIHRRGDVYVVPSHVGWVPQWSLDRLPPSLQREHELVREAMEKGART